METASSAASEDERLHALLDYRISDVPRKDEFDGCARAIAQICATECGAVTLIERDRRWVKAALEPLQWTTPWSDAFCAQTLEDLGVTEVVDATLDRRFQDSPLVAAAPWLRFYAGVALRGRRGAVLGTLCVLDRRPRTLSEAQRRALEIAAVHISMQLEIRKGVFQLQRQKDEAALAVCELKDPISVLTANGSFLAREPALSPDGQSALQDIIAAGEKLSGMVTDLVPLSQATLAERLTTAGEIALVPLEKREATDESLRTERSETDSELEKRQTLLEETADLAVSDARHTADQVLSTARQDADQKFASTSAGADAQNAVCQERAQTDRVLEGERIQADRHLKDEREELSRAVANLFSREREETDGDLLSERMAQLRRAEAAEQAFADLGARLDSQSRALEDASGTRDAFLAMASHELRTPLTSLQLQVQGLLREARDSRELIPPAILRRLAATEHHVRRLEMLVNRLLHVPLLGAGKRELRAEPIDLSALTREVISHMEDDARTAQCELVLEIAPHIRGEWDKSSLEQILANLLTNAITYGRGKPVRVRLEGDDKAARLSVEDRGIGIDPSDHRRIFHRFERAVSQRNYGGLGLGLWIVQQMVGGLGGEVSVTSKLGAGATFTVVMPLRTSPGPTER